MAFHVPEGARWIDAPAPWNSTVADGNNGAFRLPSPEPGWWLAVLASDGLVPGELGGWEHVSVHAFRRDGKQQRTPTWAEMAFIKRTFWDPEDAAMQVYPPVSTYVNNHPHTLHWWRPIATAIPLPPWILV